MKLLAAPASPFVRKVRVCIAELGLGDRVEIVDVSTTPIAPAAEVAAANPVRKIPTLLTDAGAALYDSGVITEYLNALGGHRLMPADGDARWTEKRREALADAMMDAAVGTRYEMALRPAEKQWDTWIDAQMGKVDAALDQMNAEALTLGDPAGPAGLGAIAFACAIGYLEFRFGDRNWRAGREALAAWYDAFAQRPSMQATAPGA